MVISGDCNTHACCLAFSSGAVTACFNDLGLLRLGFEHPTSRLRGQRSSPLRHRRGRLGSDLTLIYTYLISKEDFFHFRFNPTVFPLQWHALWKFLWKNCIFVHMSAYIYVLYIMIMVSPIKFTAVFCYCYRHSSLFHLPPEGYVYQANTTYWYIWNSINQIVKSRFSFFVHRANEG